MVAVRTAVDGPRAVIVKITTSDVYTPRLPLCDTPEAEPDTGHSDTLCLGALTAVLCVTDLPAELYVYRAPRA